MLQVIAICAGASIGALARWHLGLWLSVPGQLPWGTLWANAIGGYLIGLAIACLEAFPQLDPVWRLFFITGFLGALTTFSSYSAEVFHLLHTGRWMVGLLWTAAHLLASIALTAAGWYCAQAWLAKFSGSAV